MPREGGQKMKHLNILLANLIRQGEVTVNIPGLDMDELAGLVDCEAQRTLRKIAETVGCDELSDSEKVQILRGYF